MRSRPESSGGRERPRRAGVLGLLSLVGLLATGLGLAACDGSPTSPDGVGRLTVQLTDAPTDEVSAVNVFVTGLTIKPADDPVLRIANELGPIDLLSLEGTTEELVSLGVPAGDYQFVHVELDESRSDVVEVASGQTRPLRIASEEVKVLAGFTVPEGGETTITLDFDAAASLRKLGNGDWLLTPVITRVGEP